MFMLQFNDILDFLYIYPIQIGIYYYIIFNILIALILFIIFNIVSQNNLNCEVIMKGENKKQRFIRVAEKRVQNVLDSIKKLSQCSNRRMYDWDDAQLKKIWDAIGTELKNCKDSFATDQQDQFKL